MTWDLVYPSVSDIDSSKILSDINSVQFPGLACPVVLPTNYSAIASVLWELKNKDSRVSL